MDIATNGIVILAQESFQWKVGLTVQKNIRTVERDTCIQKHWDSNCNLQKKKGYSLAMDIKMGDIRRDTCDVTIWKPAVWEGQGSASQTWGCGAQLRLPKWVPQISAIHLGYWNVDSEEVVEDKTLISTSFSLSKSYSKYIRIYSVNIILVYCKLHGHTLLHLSFFYGALFGLAFFQGPST